VLATGSNCHVIACNKIAYDDFRCNKVFSVALGGEDRFDQLLRHVLVVGPQLHGVLGQTNRLRFKVAFGERDEARPTDWAKGIFQLRP
jgi:hypothetical protein